MKIAYLISAHRNPRLLARQIKTLSVPGASFYVHIDKKVDIAPFSVLSDDNLTYIPQRFVVHWGEFGLVEAIFALMSAALRAATKYDYLVLLGGSEYPLRSGSYIQQFFARNNGAEFMNSVAMPSHAAGKLLSHIDTYRVSSSKPSRRAFVRALSRAGLVKRDHRKHLLGLSPYGGDTWSALTRNACEYICDFAAQYPSLIDFFRNVPSPEEVLFQTILGGSPFQRHVRRGLMYADWSAVGRHPEMINDGHVSQFEKMDKVMLDDSFGMGEVVFARKFSDANLDLADRVDEMIRRKGLD